VLGYVTWAKKPALKDKDITLNTMFQRNYKPQKGLVFVFVYFDNQCSARACDAFTKWND